VPNRPNVQRSPIVEALISTVEQLISSRRALLWTVDHAVIDMKVCLNQEDNDPEALVGICA
jgi:hypothetical protein